MDFHTDTIILLAGLLFIVGVITAKFSTRLGVPALVLFILVGMLVGSDGLGLIHFDFSQAHFAQLIGIFALVIILFEGGLQTKWKTVQSVAVPSLSLATFGVLITSTLVAVAAKYVLGVSWLEAYLFGAIVGSTDAAAVFAVLKEQNIKDRLAATLEAESGTNDPMAVFLTLSLIELITIGSMNPLHLFGSFLWQMGAGLILGFGLGKLGSYSINKINLDSSGLYPVFALAFALLTYSVTAMIGASGLLAVYVAALVIGNQDLTYRHSIFRFNEGFAWMMQMLMFIILGLLVFPNQLFEASIFIKGILLSLILMLVARPVAVFLTTIKMRFDWKEKLFLSWAGLRGAVPIVLATFPMTAGLENSPLFFNVVFFVVLTSALIQGSTIAHFANKLQLTGPQKTTPLHSLELVSIGKANAEIVELEMKQDTPVIGKTLEEINLPKDVLVNAIIRDEQLITPYGKTTIQADDILYVLVSKKKKRQLKELFQAKES
ncbi:potassium/proton antiporter [Halalkalibacterium halodurans]|uniref:Potassium transporter n=4 Tax=Halalkalibacterium halodurans TaxID=86665 RepID=A0A0M0KCK0_ALKHA|nr:potassium/proton antiporter [Halalkalibacterium halodurans]MED3646617.1 potassium/proton antiporter [Halalkalibacterium halodurans]TPE68238.1 potassium/proton antiporter [Halalkalibacterium halodurans]